MKLMTVMIAALTLLGTTWAQAAHTKGEEIGIHADNK
jgi:hypothetical protein